MKELPSYKINQIDKDQKGRSLLLVIDEASITCNTLNELKRSINQSDLEVIIVMPESQYKKGKRGWAKAQILSSVLPQIKGILPLNYEEADMEVKSGWADTRINGSVVWNENRSLVQHKQDVNKFDIKETYDDFDRSMMNEAKRAIESSNCWLDPAGSVFVKDGGILVKSNSFTFNHTDCPLIPVSFKDLSLNEGERMMFCGSLHAERVGIAQAAQDGISLKGSTIYVSKFPCNPCAMDIIAAGIETVVFERDSYGLDDIKLLVENNIKLVRVKS